ncbi:MAG: hypothetical protein L6Q38_20080, partial [Nitrospira sp.]|nr:hypothetical protein [Nitrospira sp.]
MPRRRHCRLFPAPSLATSHGIAIAGLSIAGGLGIPPQFHGIAILIGVAISALVVMALGWVVLR